MFHILCLSGVFQSTGSSLFRALLKRPVLSRCVSMLADPGLLGWPLGRRGRWDSLKKRDSYLATTMNETTLSLKTNMRKLWADHAIWTRQYAVSALDNAPDMVAAKERLLQTPDYIGNSFVPYYGEGTGRKLAELLRKHVTLGVDLIEFAKAGDQKSFETQDSK